MQPMAGLDHIPRTLKVTIGGELGDVVHSFDYESAEQQQEAHKHINNYIVLGCDVRIENQGGGTL